VTVDIFSLFFLLKLVLSSGTLFTPTDRLLALEYYRVTDFADVELRCHIRLKGLTLDQRRIYTIAQFTVLVFLRFRVFLKFSLNKIECYVFGHSASRSGQRIFPPHYASIT
jgi:hypothetical protein